MIRFKKPDKPEYLTFSFYDKNPINHLFYDKLMVETKNIYNLSLFCYNIFDLYKKDLYNYIYESVKSNNNNIIDYDIIIINKLIDYFNEYVKIKEDIQYNNSYIYKFILNYIGDNNIIIKYSNFDNINKDIINNLQNDINVKKSNKLTTKNILIDNIVYRILYFRYNNTYNKIKSQLLNHEPLQLVDNELINEIKNNTYLIYTKNKDIKNQINELLDKKLKSDNTYISRFIYKILGEKTKYLQSTMIGAVINKVFDNISSYYKLLEKGYKANKPKYLKHNDKFNLIYFFSDIVVNDITLKLFGSEYIAKNFSEAFGNEYIKLDNNKYIHQKYLLKINDKKIKKANNYIYNNYYINKTNKNIIDSRYIVIEYFRKFKKEKIKTIEIKEIFGTYKVCISYENNKITDNTEMEINYKETISIDLGVNNLMTIYNPSGNQHIISGGPLKSLNYYITKKIGIAQKNNDILMMNKYLKLREDKINDYFNRIIKWMQLEYPEKKLVIIGYNKLWKNNTNLGKKGNLTFNKIPFIKLIDKIKMKFNVITTEESYTSKCDSLVLEDLNKKENFNGKRLKRGLFVSLSNKKINADLNGAINIMRKQIELPIITGNNLFNSKRIKIYSMKFTPVDNVH